MIDSLLKKIVIFYVSPISFSTIAWTNVDLSSVSVGGIHPRAI